MAASIELRMCGGAEVRKVSPPPRDEVFAVAEGACPYCKAMPFRVGGTGKEPAQGKEGHDTYLARAQCASAACGQDVGVLAAQVDTIFGISGYLEKDEEKS